MNVFEELLTDLKEENLLEDTVLDDHPERRGSAPIIGSEMQLDAADEAPAIAPAFEISDNKQQLIADQQESAEAVSITGNHESPAVHDKIQNGQDFFEKRAVAEVSSLQMVEHVISGVEREYMKVKPQPFDDLKVKLALNRFLKVTDEVDEAEEHKAAEFELMQTTESWCTALAARDHKIYVSSLRQYCENTKPALSSQALLALCRFYRNLPYSESTRAKFDFLLTRLFSRAKADDERICLFTRDEAIKHLENLYKDWSSIPLYAVDDDDSKVMLTALSFDDLAQESENASTFDQLIESDFFSRLRMFKESIAELCFAPQVSIAAVEANVRIGNSYVKLITAERKKMDAHSIQAKWGSIDQNSVSDATARTLSLVEMFNAPSFDDLTAEPEPVREQSRPSDERHAETKADRKRSKSRDEQSPGFFKGMMQNAFAVNKWLLTVSIILVAASIGVYVWANYFVEATVSSSSVRTVSQDNPVVREHVKTGKVSNDIFYGLLDDSWEAMPKPKRVEYLQKLLAQGPELGFTQVNLIAKDGKHAAYGSKEKIDVEMP